MDIRILERAEELRLIGLEIPRHIRDIRLPVRREGKLGLFGGDGDLGNFLLRHEPISHTVVVSPENDVIAAGRQGHLIEMVLHGSPFENLRRDILPHRPAGDPEIVVASIEDSVQKRHRDLGRSQQTDTVPLHGIGDVIARIDRHDDPSVGRLQFDILGLHDNRRKQGGQKQKRSFHISFRVI